jgi:ectoine hydroxylase-related dioxygenase (phytanoyl-CoA dioxygenase family)
MASGTTGSISEQIRGVTGEEVAHFREQGWVKLDALMSPELAGELLDHVKQLTGLDYDELPPGHPDAGAVQERLRRDAPGMFEMLRFKDDWVYDVMAAPELGEVVAELSGIRPVRLFTDGALCKMPAWTEAGFHSPTPWHQDYPPMPFDRPGGIQFWLALCEITPEMGSLQYLNGSHREGLIGAIHFNRGQTMESERPDLFEKYEISEAQHFQPGDLLAHDQFSVHFAEANNTDKLRWAYTSYRIPAKSLYNGIPIARLDDLDLGFELWKPHDHPKFPIVAE